MMQIEVKITAEPALLAVLEKIAGALMESAETVNAGWRIQEHDKGVVINTPVAATAKKDKPAPSPAPEPEPDEEIADEPETYSEPTVTLEDVRAELARLNKAGKKETTKALLTKYGADKLSEIDPEQYAALYAEAKKA